MFSFSVENFDWKEACISREEQYRMWTNSEEDIIHFVYREGIFAPVDAVHLMKVYLHYHIL